MRDEASAKKHDGRADVQTLGRPVAKAG